VPYHLRPGEPVPAGVKRIVGEEAGDAARQLCGQGDPDRDEAIHEARKNLKKIRGVLRLVEPELGETFRVENVRFRDIGRKLAHFRDAGAILETFDDAIEKCRAQLGHRKLTSIRRGLVARKQQVEQQANIDVVLRRIGVGLRRSISRTAAWPLAKDGFPALALGLEKTFRRGRKALERTRQDPCPENFHDWRKRVKEHWYHVRLLESFWSPAMEAYEKSLKELETALGEDHNLVLLSEKVLAEPSFYGSAASIAAFNKMIDRYHADLRAAAFDLGKRIYDVKPREFTRHMRRLWDARQSVSGRSTGA